MKSLKSFFGSKKVKVFLLSVAALALKEFIGLDEAAVENLMKLAMTYLGGQSAVDLTLAYKGIKKD